MNTIMDSDFGSTYHRITIEEKNESGPNLQKVRKFFKLFENEKNSVKLHNIFASESIFCYELTWPI